MTDAAASDPAPRAARPADGADWEALRQAAAAEGLDLSALRLAAGEAPAQAPEARVVVLLSPRVSPSDDGMWTRFQTSPEARDGAPDPLDRWSARVAGALARDFGGVAILPLDGPPWAPFLDWARRAEPIWPSRLGPFVHARKGLWASWRAALAFADLVGAPLGEGPSRPSDAPSPCLSCPAPCLTACPVAAFAETPEGPRYDALRCAAHLARPEGAACLRAGCLARRACPVGEAATPPAAQAGFHMAAFLRAHAGDLP